MRSVVPEILFFPWCKNSIASSWKVRPGASTRETDPCPFCCRNSSPHPSFPKVRYGNLPRTLFCPLRVITQASSPKP